MFNKFKKGEKVVVYGSGEEFGRFYYHEPAVIKERDPYYKDYLVKFKDGSEEWFLSECLKKPYTKKKGNKRYEN